MKAMKSLIMAWSGGNSGKKNQLSNDSRQFIDVDEGSENIDYGLKWMKDFSWWQDILH